MIEKEMTAKDAALSLGLSLRQVLRLKKGVQELGVNALIHKNSSGEPRHAPRDSLKEEIVTLKGSHLYSNANFYHFQELLAENEQIKISYSALYELLTRCGIKSPKKRRRFTAHRRRKCKETEGLLVQLDASPFDWLSDGKEYNLHGAIDDATGEVAGLYLAQSEWLEGYVQTMHIMLKLFGIPVSIYSDGHTIFFSPQKDKLSLEDQLAGKRVNWTQFEWAISQLVHDSSSLSSGQGQNRAIMANP